MQLSFLGGARTVTGSRFLLTTRRARILVDCGMFQGGPNEAVRNRVPLGVEPSELDAILVTHAHLDHCGLLPVVVRDGFRGPIYLTTASAELVEIVLADSGRLQEEFAKRHDRWERRHPDKAEAEDRQAEAGYLAAVEEAKRAADEGHVPTTIEPEPAPGRLAAPPPESALDAEPGETDARGAETDAIGSATQDTSPDAEAELRGQPPVLQVDLDAPLYTEDDAARVPPLFRTVRYDRPFDVAPGITATFRDAGHILGSAMIELRVNDDDGAPERLLVFSGDLGRPGTPIIRDPTVETAADYVVVESTYGGREHEPAQEAVHLLAEVVREVQRADGVLLIPAFAIGRTQEIVWQLDRLIERGEIPQLPLFLDSPMGSRVSDVYRRHPEFYDDETKQLLAEGNTPLDYPRQTVTRSVDESKAIGRHDRPYMIVASNGMLTGGRVVGHLRELIDDPGATILFVGYQGEGTLGAHLQAGAKQVRVDGLVREVRCRVRSISGFSAHADESELLDWLRNFVGGGRRPRRVFLVHGDPEAQVAIEPKVRGLGFDVYVPRWREEVSLD